MEGDIQRQEERREILLTNVKQEFPEAIVKTAPDDPWRIRIEISSPRKTAIVIEPSAPLMMDVNNGYEKIFESGISEAKSVLHNPPVGTIYQGRLYFHYNMSFEQYNGPE